MPGKLNAPAVSQLAGEIAENIEYELRTPIAFGRNAAAVKMMKAIISAALSEREEKCAELKMRSKFALLCEHEGVGLCPMCKQYLSAALSALGESK